MEQDIRWEQRFSNYRKALRKLTQAVDYVQQQIPSDMSELTDSELILDDILKEGLIQRFEYTQELAWKVMKDYAVYQGNEDITGSRDAIREAFQMNLISDGHIWMDMIKSRNLSSHTYNEETADEIYLKIVNEYFKAFVFFEKKMTGLLSANQQGSLF